MKRLNSNDCRVLARIGSTGLVCFALTVMACAQKGASSPAAAAPAGGGSATAEAEARMYFAVAAAANDVVDQLLNWDPVNLEAGSTIKSKHVLNYILYDTRMVNDITTARTFKLPLDQLYFQLYPRPAPPNPAPPTPPPHGADAVADFDENTGSLTGSFLAGLSTLSLSGVIGTLTSLASISGANITPAVTASGVAGPTDADAFIATQLINRFKEKRQAVTVFAPSIFPLNPRGTDLLVQLRGPKAASIYMPQTTDPLTELSLLQGDVLKVVRQDQQCLLDKVGTFSKKNSAPAAAPTAGPPSPAATAYTMLVADLKAAIAWSPPPPSAGGSPTGFSGVTATLPLASVRSDVLALEAASDTGSTLLGYAQTLEKSLCPPDASKPLGLVGAAGRLDTDAQILMALNTIATTLTTPIAAYGTPSSAWPGAGGPDTLGDIVTRGWQVAKLLKDPDTRVLRIHLEMSQSSTKTTTFVKTFMDSSAMANLSFMVWGNSSLVELASWSLAYFGYQNADDALSTDSLQVVNPNNFSPTQVNTKTKKG